ncbi:MAG: lipopolysaccharide heptosyltransferase II [Bdellovibrionales bacterium]|nr:lipopolysaccharide heptosyltransferase II [Bdellovibrionales bacterium]
MKILLVQNAFLGDVITSTPMIGALGELYPTAEIWFMATPVGVKLVEGDPRLAGVISFSKRGEHCGVFGSLRFARELQSHRFDLVYSLHRSFRTALILRLAQIPKRIGFRQSVGWFLYTDCVSRLNAEHDVLRNFSLLGPEPERYRHHRMRVSIPTSEQVGEAIVQVFATNQRRVCIVPGSRWYTKRWHWTRYRALAQKLYEQGLQVLILGAKEEEEIAEKVAAGLSVVNLCGKTSLPEMAYCVANSDALVCNDSLALHIGSAVQTPTVAIFCATSPEFGFGPWENRARIVELSDLPCKPCRRHGSMKCPTGTEICMRDLSEERVHLALMELMQSNGEARESVQ